MIMHNESNADRLARIALGLALLGLFFFGPKSAWGLIGLVPLLTGALGWCPLYQLLGWSTCHPRGTRRA